MKDDMRGEKRMSIGKKLIAYVMSVVMDVGMIDRKSVV